MRKIKKSMLIVLLMLFSKFTFAGQIFGSGLQEIQSEVEDAYPYALCVIFAVCFIANIHNFFGEDRNVKKGFYSMLIFVGGTLAAGAVYTFFKTYTLG